MKDFEDYCEIFGKLNRRYVKEEEIKTISDKMPHKPFLLLSVIDLIQQGEIKNNKIDRDNKLCRRFSSYWKKLSLKENKNTKNTINSPFTCLKSDGFWEVLEKNQKAEIDEELFECIIDKEKRKALRQILIEENFSSTVWKSLWENVYTSKEEAINSNKLQDNGLPTKEDCDAVIKQISNDDGQAVSEEKILNALSEKFQKENKTLKENWKLITKKNLRIWKNSDS